MGTRLLGPLIPAPLTVLSPNGGEVWPIGSTQVLRWNATGVSGKVKIELSRDGGGTWKTLFASTVNDGSQSWKVTKPETGQARVRIRSLLDANVVDTSDGNCTIY